jgi:hypothetical protein
MDKILVDVFGCPKGTERELQQEVKWSGRLNRTVDEIER